MIEFIIVILVAGFVGLAIERRSRAKVEDRQFRMLLARLNELTGRASDDFSSPLDGDKPLNEVL